MSVQREHRSLEAVEMGRALTTHKYSSSRSACAFLAISTRYAMLPAKPGKHLPRRLRAAGLHVRQSLSKRFNRFDPVKQRLVRRRVLNYKVSLVVDRQNDWASRLPDSSNHVTCTALELAQGYNVGAAGHSVPYPR